MFNMGNILKCNYQTVSTNRYVVDSPRFWREQFHPRFKDLFTFDDFKSVFLNAQEMLSFKFSDEYLNLMATNLYNYFEGFRFVAIPSKNPQSPSQFLSALYFTLVDILPALSFKDFALDDDDFNNVTNEAITGKEDQSLTNVYEDNKQNSMHKTQLDILSESNHETINTSNTENIDDESWQNNKTVNDSFLSPQNQGVTPTITNEEYHGVDGIPMYDESPFTTTTTKTNFGESNKSQSNTTQQSNEGRERLTQNNDDRTTHSSETNLDSGQIEENRTKKTDDYRETLSFDRSGKLQDFFNLNDVRLWKEIISRLMSWVLRSTIATSEINYNECQYYD